MRSSGVYFHLWLLMRLSVNLLHLLALLVFAYGLFHERLPTVIHVHSKPAPRPENLTFSDSNSTSSNSTDESEPADRSFGGCWKFLTHWNAWLQLAMAAICVICDSVPFNYYGRPPTRGCRRSPAKSGSSQQPTNGIITNSNDSVLVKSPSTGSTSSSGSLSSAGCRVHFNDYVTTDEDPTCCARACGFLLTFRDTLFHSLAFPIGMFVSLMFWGLYHIDRDLIYPVENDYKTAALINHIQHTAVGAFVFLESLVQLHEIGSRAVNLTLLLTALSSYCGWILYLGLVKHIWVYPILRKLTWIPRIGFIGGAGAAMIVLYFLGEAIYRLVWPYRRRRVWYSYRYMTHAGRRCSHHDSKNGSMGSLSLSNCSNGCHQYGSLGFCLRSTASHPQFNHPHNQGRRNSVRFGSNEYATDEDMPFSKNGQATSPSLFTLRSGVIVNNDKSMMAF